MFLQVALWVFVWYVAHLHMNWRPNRVISAAIHQQYNVHYLLSCRWWAISLAASQNGAIISPLRHSPFHTISIPNCIHGNFQIHPFTIYDAKLV